MDFLNDREYVDNPYTLTRPDFSGLFHSKSPDASNKLFLANYNNVVLADDVMTYHVEYPANMAASPTVKPPADYDEPELASRATQTEYDDTSDAPVNVPELFTEPTEQRIISITYQEIYDTMSNKHPEIAIQLERLLSPYLEDEAFMYVNAERLAPTRPISPAPASDNESQDANETAVTDCTREHLDEHVCAPDRIMQTASDNMTRDSDLYYAIADKILHLRDTVSVLPLKRKNFLRLSEARRMTAALEEDEVGLKLDDADTSLAHLINYLSGLHEHDDILKIANNEDHDCPFAPCFLEEMYDYCKAFSIRGDKLMDPQWILDHYVIQLGYFLLTNELPYQFESQKTKLLDTIKECFIQMSERRKPLDDDVIAKLKAQTPRLPTRQSPDLSDTATIATSSSRRRSRR